MERVTDQQFAVIDGHLRHVPGGVDQYLELVAKGSDRDSNAGRREMAMQGASEPDPENASASALRKDGLSNAERQRLRKEAASLERKLETQQRRAEDLRQAMGDIDPTDYLALEEQQRLIDEAAAAIDEPRDELARGYRPSRGVVGSTGIPAPLGTLARALLTPGARYRRRSLPLPWGRTL